jgi:hypothetical protein
MNELEIKRTVRSGVPLDKPLHVRKKYLMLDLTQRFILDVDKLAN